MSRAARADAADAIVLRRASPQDLGEIVAIERLSFSDPWSRESFASLLDNPAVHFAVAERPFGAGHVVAGYVVAWIVVDEAEIANIAVAPSARRLGVGARLLDDALAQVTARGARAIYLEVRRTNLPAQALYRSRGFVEVGCRRNYYRNPVEDALVLRRGLTSGASSETV